MTKDEWKARHDRLKAEGLCTRCGKRPAPEGRMLCGPCAEKGRVRSRERTAWLKSKGYCVHCGKEKAEPGRTRCLACLGRQMEYEACCPTTDARRQRRALANKARYDSLKAEGMCVDCGKRPAEGGVLCPFCRAYRNAAARRRYERTGWREAGLCPKCGKPPAEGYKLCPEHLAAARDALAKVRHKPGPGHLWNRQANAECKTKERRTTDE